MTEKLRSDIYFRLLNDSLLYHSVKKDEKTSLLRLRGITYFIEKSIVKTLRRSFYFSKSTPGRQQVLCKYLEFVKKCPCQIVVVRHAVPIEICKSASNCS